MRSKGVTLIEILIVIGILLVLSAIGFILLGPARVSAKRSSCAERMRQIHQAATMYAIDWDDAVRYPEIPGFTYMPLVFTEALKPYVKDKEIWYCTACPGWLKERFGNTYGITLWGSDALEEQQVGGNTIPSKRRKMIKLEEQMGSGAPIVYCTIHDEFEIAPGDPEATRMKMKPYLRWVGVDGGLRAGRVDWQARFFYSNVFTSVRQ